jgi:hypothetical protein
MAQIQYSQSSIAGLKEALAALDEQIKNQHGDDNSRLPKEIIFVETKRSSKKKIKTKWRIRFDAPQD